MGVSTPVAGKKISINAIHKQTGYALQTVQKWEADGMPALTPDCFIWIIERQRKQILDRSADGLAAQEQRERIALLKERRQRERIKRMHETGKVVLRDAVNREWLRRTTEARQQIETIPNLIAMLEPEGELREIKRREAAKVVKNALDGLARKKPDADDRQNQPSE